jgi:hypothetical protein
MIMEVNIPIWKKIILLFRGKKELIQIVNIPFINKNMCSFRIFHGHGLVRHVSWFPDIGFHQI